MSIGAFVGLYLATSVLLVILLRSRNAAVSSSVRRMEDAEQMAAVGRGLRVRGAEHDPYATLS